jgi:hypothetical protein
MANHKTDRVLSRVGARELTPEEVERVNGNGTALGRDAHTMYVSFASAKASSGDGDGLGI